MWVLIFWVLVINFLSAQEKFTVKKIVFIGNEKTKKEVIARELSFGVGSQIDTSDLAYSENRVYGTGLFNRVKIWAERDSGDSSIVYVWVNERWYIWPFPILGWKDRDLKKMFYGAGLIHTNFRGRNEKLIFSFALGYDPWIEAEYLNPWVLGSKNLFYSVEVFYQRVKNRSKILEEEFGSFYERHLSFALTFGKRYGLYKRFWGSIGFKEISTTGEVPYMKTLSPSGRDQMFVFGGGFRYDTRDIPIYPSRGFLVSVGYKFNRLINCDCFFLQGGLEFQGFKKIGIGLIASRFFILNSFGREIPVYSHFYFGYNERIRGYFNDVFEGENIFGGTVEYRIPFVKQKFFKWNKAPLEEFSILRFGVDLVLFGDFGNTWFNREKVLKLRYLSGCGVGINFILPYDLILSVGFARNVTGRGQFFIDFKGGFE